MAEIVHVQFPKPDAPALDAETRAILDDYHRHNDAYRARKRSQERRERAAVGMLAVASFLVGSSVFLIGRGMIGRA